MSSRVLDALPAASFALARLTPRPVARAMVDEPGAGPVHGPTAELATDVAAAVRRALDGEPIVALAGTGRRPPIIDVVTVTRTARITVHPVSDRGTRTAHVTHAIDHDDVHAVFPQRNSAVITHVCPAVPGVVVAGRLLTPLRKMLQGRRSGHR